MGNKKRAKIKLQDEEKYVDGTFIEKRYPNNRKMISIEELMLFHICPTLFLNLHSNIPSKMNAKEIKYMKALALRYGIRSKLIAELIISKSVDINDWARRTVRIMNRILTDNTNAQIKKNNSLGALLAIKKVYEKLVLPSTSIREHMVVGFSTQEQLDNIIIKESIDILYYSLVKKKPEALFIMADNQLFSDNACLDVARMNAALCLDDISNINEYIVTVLLVRDNEARPIKFLTVNIDNKKHEIEHYSRKLISLINEYKIAPLTNNWLFCKNCIYNCMLTPNVTVHTN